MQVADLGTSVQLDHVPTFPAEGAFSDNATVVGYDASLASIRTSQDSVPGGAAEDLGVFQLGNGASATLAVHTLVAQYDAGGIVPPRMTCNDLDGNLEWLRDLLECDERAETLVMECSNGRWKRNPPYGSSNDSPKALGLSSQIAADKNGPEGASFSFQISAVNACKMSKPIDVGFLTREINHKDSGIVQEFLLRDDDPSAAVDSSVESPQKDNRQRVGISIMAMQVKSPENTPGKPKNDAKAVRSGAARRKSKDGSATMSKRDLKILSGPHRKCWRAGGLEQPERYFR
ncbi:hypothetical protein B0H13DRAFT_1851028 [Mycena leptocephala]|nr:hypothetical protein B0H13DRAFT_1851028 [Mycena leptocephala]